MPRETILIGPVHTLVSGTVYACPPRACVYFVQGSGTVEVSNDASTWLAVTPDSNGMFLSSAPFMRANGANATVTPRIQG